MTPRQQDLTRRIAWGALVVAFSVGSAWATVQSRVGAVERDLAAYREQTDQKLDAILSRVSALYCAQVPEPIRAACQ